MLSENLKYKSPEVPKTQIELVEFVFELAKLERMTMPSTVEVCKRKEYQEIYEAEYLTEVDDKKFDLLYGAASVLRDRILDRIDDPNPHNWPMGYYEDALALIRLSDILDYGAEGDFLAESILAIARKVIKYFESNPAPKVNSDLIILEGVAKLVNDFYQERTDSSEAIDCIAMLDLLTAVKKQAIQFALEPVQELDEIVAAREAVQNLYEDALEDSEAARDHRLNYMREEDLALGGVELLHGTWMKVASNYANWLYRVDMKEGALELAQRILKIDGSSPVAINVKANCKLDLEDDLEENDLKLLEMQLNGVLEMLPKQLEYLYTIGRIKVREGDFKGIGEVVNRLQIADPKDKTGYVKRLMEELDQGKHSVPPAKPVLH